MMHLPSYTQNKGLFEMVPSTQTGIDFKNTIKENESYNALTYQNLYNGGGVSVGDINNDGLDDIFFISNMEHNKLYLNLGNFKFKNVTVSAGVAGREGWKSGTAMVDINGDGLLDIYVCYSGKNTPDKRRNQFFINKGNLRFEDQAQLLGLDDPSYTTQSAFFDFDRDGDLDVFLLNTNVKVIHDLEYGDARKLVHPYAGDKLFRNDGGRFIEITQQAGILSNALGFGLGVAVSDVNKDGWPDLYVSNDYAEPDYLYINNHDGTFSDKLNESVQHISQFSMGSDIADINNDSWPDIFTSDMLPEDNQRQKLLYGPDNYEQFALMINEGFHYQYMRNMLHVNNGNGTFSEVGQLAGVSNTDWSWAPLFADFDNDGWKDLFVTNGYFRDYTNRDFLKFKSNYYFKKVIDHEKADTLELAKSMTSTPLHNYMFRNNGGITFTDKSEGWGFGKLTFSNGAAFSDLDNDGDLDLIVNNQNDMALIYRNRSREINKSNFLRIQLKGSGKNTSGLGSSVTIYVGEATQFQEQMPMRGYQSSVSHTLHFGLGDKPNVDSIVVKWLSGKVSVVKDVQTNKTVVVNELDSKPALVKKSSASTPVFTAIKPPLTYQHTEYGANDFKRQPLLTTMLSPCGPVLATADVNGDGRTDVFAGGTKENPGKLYIQKMDGTFDVAPDFLFSEDVSCSDADALFFDADHDGDVDLYVASGGYHEFNTTDKALQDRFFINDGRGRFTKSLYALPIMAGSKSCVRASDFDLDGDLDLFVGGRVVPNFYPAAPESFLLINNGFAKFSNAINTIVPTLSRVGMITDAVWLDVNKDNYPDLIVAGEFMPIKIYINKQGKELEEVTNQFFDQPHSGFWNRLITADFDHDGDEDLLAGNFGLNSQLKATTREPLTLTFNDFDKNGSIDPILTTYIQGKPYPFAGRDELLDQIYSLRKKFTSYASYAGASLTNIFSTEELAQAKSWAANELRTMYFENKGNTFVKHELPLEAQYAPVHAIEILDYDQDGNLDFILAGNQSNIRIRLGKVDANYGQLYKGNGKGDFTYIPQTVSGISLVGDVKSLKMINANGKKLLLVGVNNQGILAYNLTDR